MMIDIVMICDNNYVMPTSVAITSIVQNKAKETSVTFYILTDNLTDENIALLLESVSNSDKLVIKHVDSSIYAGLEKRYSNVSRAALLKFSIPTVLENVGKVLYLDGDIIALRDLTALFSIDLATQYAAVVQDGPKPQVIPGGKDHEFYRSNMYFNSGMMLLNLKQMRKDSIADKLISYRMNEYNYFMDQDAFNKIFGNKVVYAGLQYDFMLHLVSYRNPEYSLSQLSKFYECKEYNSIDELFNNLSIIHYTFDKPWKYYDIAFAETWKHYYDLSPFANITLNRESYINYLYYSKPYQVGKKIAEIYRVFIKKR